MPDKDNFQAVLDVLPRKSGEAGGGKGLLIQDDHTGAITANDGNKVVQDAVFSSGDISQTIDGHYYLGCGNRGGKEREFLADPIRKPKNETD